MPNSCRGNVQIEGDAESMKPIIEWAKSYADIDFNTLIPLPCKEYDYDIATKYWGNKWGVSDIESIPDIIDNCYVSFDFNSPWCMPAGLFYQLEKKYKVSVTSAAYDYDNAAEFYEDGKYGSLDINYENFVEWHIECNKHSLENLPPYPPKNDIEYNYWNEIHHKHEMEYVEFLFDLLKEDLSPYNPEILPATLLK
jgi:hypothetical protein